MIPDLLLALLGVPGDVFVRDAKTCALTVASDIDFITSTERQRFNAVVRVGTSYAVLERTIAQCTDTTIEDAHGRVFRRSIYRRALARALKDELSAYEGKILKLEQDALRGASASSMVSTIESALHGDDVVLRALCENFEGVFADENVMGSEVLRAARDAWLRAGHPDVREAFERVYWKVTQVMMQQMLGWCAYGTIVDPCDEFFVKSVSDGDHGDDADGSGVWHKSHRVALERLPPAVELETAEAISFIGRGVRILTHPSKGESVSGRFDADAYAKKTTARIRKLAAAEAFEPREFEAVVEILRAEIARSLGKILLDDAKLITHLQTMRGFYFLGKGDLFSMFLDDARNLLALPPKPGSAGRDLATPFTLAVSKAVSNEDSFTESFILTYASVITQKAQASSSSAAPSPTSAFAPRVHIPEYDAWDGIGLECTVPWPMGIFLTEETLDRYRTIFRYLFRLKRVQYDLQDVWVRLRRTDLKFTLRLRHSMAMLIENWLTYVQVDVIEVEFQKMIDAIGSTTDFNKCTLAHREYLATVMAQSFLDVGSITSIFEDILALTRELCVTCVNHANGQALPADWDDRSAYLRRQFDKESAELFDALRSTHAHTRARNFLLRFNFNDHFEGASSNTFASRFQSLEM